MVRAPEDRPDGGKSSLSSSARWPPAPTVKRFVRGLAPSAGVAVTVNSRTCASRLTRDKPKKSALLLRSKMGKMHCIANARMNMCMAWYPQLSFVRLFSHRRRDVKTLVLLRLNVAAVACNTAYPSFGRADGFEIS